MPTQEKLGRGFGKNAGEWTGKVEISRDEILGSRRSMHGNIRTCSRFERENLDESLISASAVPHRGKDAKHTRLYSDLPQVLKGKIRKLSILRREALNL